MFKKREISIDGKKYPIKLTLAAWVKVCEKYESPQGMIDAFQADKTKALLEGYPWLIALLINSAAEAEGVQTDKKTKAIKPEYVAAMMRPAEMQVGQGEAMRAVVDAFAIEEANEDDERDEVLEELEAKNG